MLKITFVFVRGLPSTFYDWRINQLYQFSFSVSQRDQSAAQIKQESTMRKRADHTGIP